MWVLSLLAAVRALFGDGGLKVAALAIVPIVLLLTSAISGVAAAAPASDTRGRPTTGQPPPGLTAVRSFEGQRLKPLDSLQERTADGVVRRCRGTR